MSVQSQIDRIGQNVADTYAVLDALGADMPSEQNSDNLARTAGTAKAVLYSKQTLTDEQKEQARQNIGVPNKLPNPHALTINGKAYDGSEPVDLVITGGGAGENIPLGQTPITLSQIANIKLVGEGEYSYSIKGKTFGDVSSASISKTMATLTDKGGYYELESTGGSAWHASYVTLGFSGLTVGTKYVLVVEGYGVSLSAGIGSTHCIIKNASGTTLATLSGVDTAKAHTVEFTADTESINISCYVSDYYFSREIKIARFNDFYINEASNGTERTGVYNESGTFTDSYSLGQLAKGVTITATPSCEVYAVSGGGGSGEASAPLEGKTVVCFGDSLFGMYTGDSSAPAYVAKKTGATVYNVGFGGCRMSEHPYTGYNEFCMYALADAVASGDWSAQDAAAGSGSSNFPDQLAILKEIDFDAVDYVVIHYGTNDFTAGSGLVIDNPSKPKATNTFCGAFRHSVETLLGAFPKLKIFVSLPAFRFWKADNGTVTYSDEYKNGNGNILPDFVKALAEAAKEYKLPVIDCYYGMGVNKSNASTFMDDGVHHNPEGCKRFGEYIGAKLISEGDAGATGADGKDYVLTPADKAEIAQQAAALVPSGGGGGSGISVTAEVGQTIIVKAVDSNGKPTEWEAAEYQPRTHWSEFIELSPLTEITPFYYEALGVPMGIMANFNIVVGNKYKVTFDGVEYVCDAYTGTMAGQSAPAFGNTVFTGGSNTGEPFIIFKTQTDPGAIIVFFDMNPHSVRVESVVVTPIPVQYVSNAFPYYIEVTGEGTADDPYVCNDTVKNVEALFPTNRLIEVRFKRLGFEQFFSLVVKIIEEGEHYSLYFLSSLVARGGSPVILGLLPNADGGYDVMYLD